MYRRSEVNATHTNSLPFHNPHLPTIECFKRGLKAHLFHQHNSFPCTNRHGVNSRDMVNRLVRQHVFLLIFMTLPSPQDHVVLEGCVEKWGSWDRPRRRGWKRDQFGALTGLRAAFTPTPFSPYLIYPACNTHLPSKPHLQPSPDLPFLYHY